MEPLKTPSRSALELSRPILDPGTRLKRGYVAPAGGQAAARAPSWASALVPRPPDAGAAAHASPSPGSTRRASPRAPRGSTRAGTRSSPYLSRHEKLKRLTSGLYNTSEEKDIKDGDRHTPALLGFVLRSLTRRPAKQNIPLRLRSTEAEK
eukprot:6180117-Pyramimonas_sp.AAC.1